MIESAANGLWRSRISFEFSSRVNNFLKLVKTQGCNYFSFAPRGYPWSISSQEQSSFWKLNSWSWEVHAGIMRVNIRLELISLFIKLFALNSRTAKKNRQIQMFDIWCWASFQTTTDKISWSSPRTSKLFLWHLQTVRPSPNTHYYWNICIFL